MDFILCEFEIINYDKNKNFGFLNNKINLLYFFQKYLYLNPKNH